MAAPTSPLDLNTTASSNGPDGATEQVSVLDDYIRGLSASVKHLVVKGADIVSAATITPAATASFFDITGTTGITAIGSTNSWDGRRILFQFDGVLTITHASTLKLPTAANITTAAGDIAEFVQETSGTWRCTQYLRANGNPLAVYLGASWSIDGSGRLLNGGDTQPKFCARGATGTTPVVFGTEDFDHGSVYNNTTGIFTAPVAGVYAVSVTLGSSALATTGRIAGNLIYNTSTIIRVFSGYKSDAGESGHATMTTLVDLAANDTLEVNSTGAVNPSSGTTHNYFSVQLVG